MAARGALALRSRQPRSTGAASSIAKKSSTTWARRATGCSRNSNSVTTPKLPPPPRSPQKSSGSVGLVDTQPLAVGGDQLERRDVVAREPELAGEPAHPAAERQPADAGVGHVARGRRQPVLHRGAIERAEQRAALDPGATALRIDADAAHRGQVDHQAAVRDAQPEHAVPAAAHADLEVALAAVADRLDHVVRARTADDRPWPAVDHRVPHRSRLVVSGGAVHQQQHQPHVTVHRSVHYRRHSTARSSRSRTRPGATSSSASARGPATLSELAEPFGLTLNGVKKHVGVLERVDLVATEKVGRARHCRLGPASMDGGDGVDGEPAPRVGQPPRSLRALRRADRDEPRPQVRAADRRRARARLRRLHRARRPARVLRQGRRRMDRRLALRPARRRRLGGVLRPVARRALPPPPRVRGDRPAAPDPHHLDRDPPRRLELRDELEFTFEPRDAGPS